MRSFIPLIGAIAFAMAAVGCASSEAARQVSFSTMPASSACVFVAEQLKGSGEDEDRARWDLAKRAAHRGANFVRLRDSEKSWSPVAMQMTPWTLGRVVIVYGDAFSCPDGVGAAPSERAD